MPNPGIRVNCPLCGLALVYVRTDDDTHIFRCATHGALILPPDGRIRQQPT